MESAAEGQQQAKGGREQRRNKVKIKTYQKIVFLIIEKKWTDIESLDSWIEPTSDVT